MNEYLMCVILFLALCFMIIYTFNLKDFLLGKIKLYKKEVIFFSIFLVFSFSIFSVLAQSDEKSVVKSTNKELQNIFFDKKIQNIALNKIIIVGDSRMEFIYNKKDVLNIPSNFIFDSKSGATIDWLVETGGPELEKILDQKDDDYTYHVIFNLGVNDLSSLANPKKIADNYFELYNDIIQKYSDVKFYFLSVNPIDEEIINDYFPSNNRTNDKIELFNARINQDMLNSNFSNAYYCDSYNMLDFYLPDGLHYDDETDQKIIDYIARNCVIFK